MTEPAKLLKRFVKIVLAVVGLVVIAVSVYRIMSASVLIRRHRPGLYERPFASDRTMTASAKPLERFIELVLAVVGLVVLAPFMAVIAVGVYFTMGAPVLFRQQRPGLHGRPFTIYKFRTMTNGCDDCGNLLSDGERMTRFGNFLRKSSLDELPELFNVLRNEMAFVGPRPLLVEYLEHYSPEQMRRHDVKPGITGWAQIHGRNTLTWEEKFEHDLWYVDHRSWQLDVRIILLTFRKVFSGEGINQPGQATADMFMGSPLPQSSDIEQTPQRV